MSHHNSELSEGKAWVCGPLSMSKRIAQRLKCVGDSIHLQSLENSFPVFIQYQRRLQSVLSQFEMSDYVSFFKQPLPTLKKEYYTFTSSHICEPYRKFQVNNLRQTVWNFSSVSWILPCKLFIVSGECLESSTSDIWACCLHAFACFYCVTSFFGLSSHRF